MDTTLRIRNRTRDTLLVSEGRHARSFWTRLRGLLGQSTLRAGQGLWIVPCQWVHTLGMKSPIDVLYLDRDGWVVHAASEMCPNRIGSLVWRAKSVVELPSGVIEETGTSVGDQLEMTS